MGLLTEYAYGCLPRWCVMRRDLVQAEQVKCLLSTKLKFGVHRSTATYTQHSHYALCLLFFKSHMVTCGPGSSVGIATDLRAGRSEIESRWGRDFSPVQTGPGAHPASCKMGTGSFPGVKCGRGVLLTTHPLLVPRSWKSRVILLPTLWATPGL